MIKNSTPLKWNILVFICINVFSVSTANAQTYCSPAFANGCLSWNNQSIALTNLNWSLGTTDCLLSDYTTDTAIVNAGTPHSMQVTNGSWCGTSIWVDFNSNGAFDTTENLYHLYTANQTNYYSFNLIVPSNIPSGSYRMRVIASWGSDGYSVSANGYGGCGSYQYGNFDDFTLKVIGSSGTINPDANSNLIKASPNPANDFIKVTVNSFSSDNATLQLCDVSGKRIEVLKVYSAETVVDMRSYSKGIYFINYTNGDERQTIKVVK